jgi:hypothetical protein
LGGFLGSEQKEPWQIENRFAFGFYNGWNNYRMIKLPKTVKQKKSKDRLISMNIPSII